MTPLVDRFMAKVLPEPNSGCWLWNGAKHRQGYGQFRVDNLSGMKLAHRISYKLFVCDPGTQCVLHKCDVTACVNPDHLFLGSYTDNNRDCVSKGRHIAPDTRGTLSGNAKLDDDAVRHIRKREMPIMAYASKYGVSRASVCNVILRKTWCHI